MHIKKSPNPPYGTRLSLSFEVFKGPGSSSPKGLKRISRLNHSTKVLRCDGKEFECFTGVNYPKSDRKTFKELARTRLASKLSSSFKIFNEASKKTYPNLILDMHHSHFYSLAAVLCSFGVHFFQGFENPMNYVGCESNVRLFCSLFCHSLRKFII